MSVFNIITLFGGLALFLYGMRIMGDGLKEGSTDTLRKVLEKVTNNPAKGFLVGMVMTAIIGFGILFTGLLSMTGAVEPLSKEPAFTNLFVKFGNNPFLAYLVGVAVAFILQSSSATIGILQDILSHTYTAFSRLDFEAARKIEPVEEVVDDMVASLKDRHIKRLREGQCTIQNGLVFLDVLTNVERISDQCSNVGVYTMSLADARAASPHDYISVLHQGQDEYFNKAFKERHDYYFGELEK